MYMAIQEQEEILVYSKEQAQIKAQSQVQLKALSFDKVLTEVLIEYSDYSKVF